jgi:nitroreductase
MEFRDVVRRRKMVRTFEDRPVASDMVDRILDTGRRAPSAGFSQGFAFLLFEGAEDVGRFWSSVSPDGRWPSEGLRGAPVVVVPLAGKRVYLDRYAEADKGWGDRSEARWPVPYWTVDTAFASMLILLAAVEEGLGALFFGMDGAGYRRLRETYAVPEDWEPIGVIALGHPASVDAVQSSRDTRARRPLEEVIHRGSWSA